MLSVNTISERNELNIGRCHLLVVQPRGVREIRVPPRKEQVHEGVDVVLFAAVEVGTVC